jgi:hypothetical protein
MVDDLGASAGRFGLTSSFRESGALLQNQQLNCMTSIDAWIGERFSKA